MSEHEDTRLLEGSVNTGNRNVEVKMGYSKEVDLEVNPQKSLYLLISRDHNSGEAEFTCLEVQ
jgi:hypothetical protein